MRSFPRKRHSRFGLIEFRDLGPRLRGDERTLRSSCARPPRVDARVFRRAPDASPRARGEHHRRGGTRGGGAGAGQARVSRRPAGGDPPLHARPGLLDRLAARQFAGGTRISVAGRRLPAADRPHHRTRQHRQPGGRARAQARSHPRRRQREPDLCLARGSRPAADRHSLRAAGRPFRRDCVRLSHARHVARARAAWRRIRAHRRGDDQDGHAAHREHRAAAARARLLRARPARTGNRARRIDQRGDDRTAGTQRRRRHPRRPRQRLDRAGADLESRGHHHHRPGFRRECVERSGLVTGGRRARAPGASFANPAVRLGRFSAWREPADRTVVACQDALSGAVRRGRAHPHP